VRVDDNHGENDSQSFFINVAGAANNRAPYITSTPPHKVTVGNAYPYQVIAFDPDDVDFGKLQYSLISTDSSISIDSQSGKITWTPTTLQNGVPVTVTVKDHSGASDAASVSQSFTIDVLANQQPRIDFTQNPLPNPLLVGRPFTYYVPAKDDDGDKLTYSLTGAPTGMTIDDLGRINWTPPVGIVPVGLPSTDITFTITATDSKGLSAATPTTLTVNADTQKPKVGVRMTDSNGADVTTIALNSNVTFTVTASDNAQLRSIGLTVGGRIITLDKNGQAVVPMTQIGTFSVLPNAIDFSGNVSDPLNPTVNLSVTVTGNRPPTVLITGPVASGGAFNATDMTAIIGTASDVDGNFASYQLTAWPIDNPTQVTTVKSAATQVTNGTLGTFDPTLLRNGTYILQLSATDGNNITSTTQITLTVSGDMKVGNTRFSETDLVIPVSGIPITITRTYDSLNRLIQKDLGYGWSLDFDVDLQEGLEARTDYTADILDQNLYNYPGSPPNLSIRSGGDRDVWLTIPGGQRAHFAFTLNPTGGGYYAAGFTPDPGVHATLSIKGNNTVIDSPLGGQYWQASSHTEGDLQYNLFDRYDIPGYILTLEDGTQFTIDKQENPLTAAYGNGRFYDINGNPIDSVNSWISHIYDSKAKLTQISDPRGNRLDITDSGITSTDGAAITFDRSSCNQNGAICNIKDSVGTTLVTFGYATNGDLISVTRLVVKGTPPGIPDTTVTTSYAYEVGGTHRFESMTSPLGKKPLINHYDSTGRLSSVEDLVNQKSTTFSYTDIGNKHETVTDRRNGVTNYYFDVNGDVTRMIDPAGVETQYVYTDRRVIQETDAAQNSLLSLVKSYTYDTKGFRTQESFQLDGAGSPTVTTNWHYMDTTHGEHVLAQIDSPDGTITKNSYDPATGVLTETDVLDNSAPAKLVQMTTYGYDYRGNQTLVKRWTQFTTGAWVPYSESWTYYNAMGYVNEQDERDDIDEIDVNGNLIHGHLIQKTTFDPDSLGNNLHVYQWKKDNNGNWVSYATTTNVFDKVNRLKQSTDPLSRNTFTTFNDDGQIQDTTDIYGIVTRYGYDNLGELTTTTHAYGRPEATVESTSYDFDGHVQKETGLFGDLAAGRYTQYFYDAASRLVQTKYADGTSEEMTYDPAGRVDIKADRHVIGTTANATRTSYDRAGLMTGTQRYTGVTVSVSTDANGVSTITATIPQGQVSYSTTSITYENAGRVYQSTGTDGQTTTNVYDSAGRLSQVRDALLNYTTYGYDSLGRQNTVTDALTHTTTSVYDELGRVTKSVFADGSSISQAYDALGRKTSSTDELGRITTYEYDVIGDLTAVNQPTTSYVYNNTTYQHSPRYEYFYNSLGELILQRDAMDNGVVNPAPGAQSRQTQYAYDAFGRRQERALPGQTLGTTATELDTFDKYGRVVTHRDFKGQYTRYVYDDDASLNGLLDQTKLGRVVYERFYLTSAITNPPKQEVYYHYNTLGQNDQIQQRTDGVLLRTSSYTFDSDNRVIIAMTPEGTINYQYYLNTGRLQRTYTADDDTYYGYDELGRLKTVVAMKLKGVVYGTTITFIGTGQDVSSNSTIITRYTYDTVGNLASAALPNSIVTSYTYDMRNRLDIETVTQNGQTLRQYDYHVLANGQRDYVQETSFVSGNPTNTSRIDWQYDTLGRLTYEKLDGNNNGTQDNSDYVTMYQYDLVGNRTSKVLDAVGTANDLSIVYGYNALDQLNTETAIGTGAYTNTYTYDLNGSLIQKTRSVSNPGTVKYVYDVRNRLSSLDANANGGNPDAGDTNYAYDDAGNRVQSAVVGGSTTNFLVDSNNPTGYAQVLEEKNGSTVNLAYLLGSDVIAQADSAGPAYMVYDGHGSTRMLLKPGNVTETYDYDAFGNTISTGSISTKLLYSGEQFDSGLKQYYMRARYYDQAVGRFSSFDSFQGDIADPATLHKFLYTGDDPVDGIDPSGFTSILEQNAVDGIQIKLLAGLTAATLASVLLSNTVVQTNVIQGIQSIIASGEEATEKLVSYASSRTKEFADALARALKDAAKAGRQALNQLKRLQPFFVVKSITPSIFAFDVRALKTTPSWFVLNYNGPNNPATATNRAIVRAKFGALMASAPKIPPHQLDEFPYASTWQGGARALGQPVPATENLTQGGYLSVFYRYQLRGTAGRPFIVVPVPI
jgi:RHS repeat-associated protein